MEMDAVPVAGATATKTTALHHSTSGLSEYESQCLREQIHKVEFFLLRAMDFHLEMPPAEGALMLKIYFARFRLIFVDGAFNWLFEVDQGEEQGGEAPAQEQPSATSGTVKEKVNKKRNRKLPSGIRVVGEGATWQEKRVRFGFRPTADNNCTPSWSGSAGDETKCVLPLCGSRNIYRILKEVKGAAAASTLPSTTTTAGAGALSPPEPTTALSSSQQQHDAAAARAAAHEFWLDNLSEIKVTARNFYTDAFRTFVVLKYLPHKIAIASLFLSIVFRCQKNDELGQKILSWAAVNNFEEEEDENGIKEGTEHRVEDHFSTTNNAATASTTHPTPVSTTTGGTSHAPVGTGGTNPLRGGATALHDAVYELLCFLEPDVERAEIKVIFEEIVAMVGCHQQEKGVLRKPKLQEQKVDEVVPSGSAGSSHAGPAPATGTRLTQDLRRYAAAARAPVPSVAAKGAGKHRPGTAGPIGNKTPGLLATRSRALPAPPPLPPGAKSISERKNAGATSSSVATASGVAAATSTAQQVIADEKIPRTTLRRKAEESGEDAHVDGGGSRLKQAKFDHENDVKNTERMRLSRQKSFFGASPPGVGRAESSKLGGAGAAAKSPAVEIEDGAVSSNRRSRERERSRHRKSKRRRSDREQPQETGVASSHSRRSRRRRRRPKRHASLLEDVSAERGEHSSLGSADIIRTPADMGGVENDAQNKDAHQRDQNMQQRVGASPTHGSAGRSLSRGRRSLASGYPTRRREEVEQVQLPEDGGGEPRDEDEPRRSYSVESSLSSSSSSSSSSGSRGSGSGSGPSHSFSSSSPSSSGKDGVGAVPGREHEHEHKREPPDAGGGIQGNS